MLSSILFQILRGIYIFVGVVLSLYGIFALFNVMYFKFFFKGQKKTLPPISIWPYVSIVLPIYNESAVVERLLNAVAELEYEKRKFQIIILDDSTDETSDKIKAFISNPNNKVLDIYLQKRSERDDYKTGALRKSMNKVKGEFIAIFDADFVPPADFLLRTIPYLVHNERLGFVQTRWGFINTWQSTLTIIQSFSFDAHFLIEKQLEQAAGYFINYNGSAGIWRKSTIIDCGGWPVNALSEDLEISFRAQTRGWAALYLPEVIVPSELPSSMYLLGIQQERWAFGALQVFRKLWKNVLLAKTSKTRRIHALSFLSVYFVFVFLVVQPLIYLVSQTLLLSFPVWPLVLPVFLMAAFNMLSVLVIPRQECRYSYCFLNMILYVFGAFGLSVRMGWGAFKGMLGLSQAFIRTPKNGAQKIVQPINKRNIIAPWQKWLGYVLVEMLFAIYLLYGILFLDIPVYWLSGTALLFFVVGYVLIGVWTIFEALNRR